MMIKKVQDELKKRQMPDSPGCGPARVRRPLATMAAILVFSLFFISSPAALADDPPCLPDSNGDGHPLFGNLEYTMLYDRPVALAMGDLDAAVRAGRDSRFQQ